ncbi:glycosyltransferase family 2 protein [Mesorhizobium sp. M1088]|uniref:glycosyltransferase family 2 protein n=1 Tax=unclassified Mesorhizobium TaxID=325217 RepID=UPI003336EDB3
MSLAVIILTFNEEQHIERALDSVKDFAGSVLVVDCGSSDNTVNLAKACGAEVKSNPWINYATQFNWALTHVPSGTTWVLRLDADEVVTSELACEIKARLSSLGSQSVGIFVSRRMKFLGRPIRYGGLFPIRVLRLFRLGYGHCENRWMDEHIIVTGKTVAFNGEIIDDNLNSLTWWTQKHNSYASREVIDLLNLEYGFTSQETVAELKSGQQAAVKRWLKERVYVYLPRGFRACVYFLYRYVLRCGFLDGREGAIFHLLQGFWYRFLVDAKLYEVKEYMRRTGTGPVVAIKAILHIDVDED